MKKAIALLAAFALVFTISAPALAKQDTGKQLEELILKVKSAIEIPESFESFTSDMRTDEDGTTYWNLNWSEKGDNERYWDRNGISVGICDDGLINSYSKYNGKYKYSEYVKIPAISMDEATTNAKNFISKVCPEIEGQIAWTSPSVNEGNFNFNFTRKVNNVNVNFNSMSLTVNGTTGEVNNYYANWNSKLAFPSIDNAISLEKAQESYKQNMPLNLEYRINSDNNVYLQYAPSRERTTSYINAITGKPEKIEYNYDIYSGRGEGKYYSDKQMNSTAITPAEQTKIDEVAGAITAAEAEKKIRAISEFKIDDSYKVISSNLSQNKINNTTIYYLGISFLSIEKTPDMTEEKMKLMIASGDGNGNAYATLNAKTGEILNFSSFNNMKVKKTEEKKFTRENGKKTADDFIAKYQPNKESLMKYVENGNVNNYYQYYRVENGAYFDYDGINVSVDELTGKITQYNCTWNDNISIPKIEGIITSDKAHELLFSVVGLKMEYVLNKKEAVLVYKTDDAKPQFFDAISGVHLDYSGKPYSETVTPEYDDITGHFSETAVKELLNVRVFLNSKSFSPDSNILQKDYLTLLSKLGKYYAGTEDINNIYDYMISNGILEASEKNPDGNLTREDAVKFLLRYLDYKKFAEIPGIFNCDFLDIEEINPSLIGYATIAKGLGVISGSDGYFNPKDILTKGESAVIIYNCLKADIK